MKSCHIINLILPDFRRRQKSRLMRLLFFRASVPRPTYSMMLNFAGSARVHSSGLARLTWNQSPTTFHTSIT